MARIYKRSDRIPVKIDDITVRLSPLSVSEKTEIQQAMLNGRAKSDLKELTRGISLAIKYSVKSVDGVVDSDGNPYKLEFDGDGLSQDSIDELMNMELTKKLSMVCAAMVSGVPKEFVDNDGNPLDGVEFINPSKTEPEKKP